MSFLRNISQFIKLRPNSLFHSSASLSARKIEITESDNEVVIEGVSVERPAAVNCGSGNCHPLCRLPFVHEIKHTDVLILDQFVGKNGEIIPRKVTGLCRRQHYRMNKLIRMAQKAGLFPPEKDVYREEKKDKYMIWNRMNTYWDEKTIDIQWHNFQRNKKIASFKK